MLTGVCGVGQLRLNTTVKLHAVNCVVFCVLQTNDYLIRGSLWHVLGDSLGFAAAGLSVPIAITVYSERQARQEFIAKARHLTPSQLGPYWGNRLPHRYVVR